MGLVHHPNVVSDGIKFYWDAANRRSYPGTGTSWDDIVKSKSASINNPTFTNQKGGYIEFDGTNDDVTIANDADFTMPAGDWTICVWCQDLGGNADKRHIIGTYGSYPRWVIRDTDDHAAGWAFVTNSGDGWAKAYSTVDIQDTDDEWHYLVVTGSAGGSSGSLKLYTDGVDTSLSSSYAVESITRSPGAITMGTTENNAHDFMGYIASVAIYSRILTPAEVKQNYEATKSRFEPRITKSGLVGNWDAGDPQCYVGGDTCKDTARGIIGTLQNATTFDSANGGCWGSLDGTDEFINTNSSDYTTANGFTGMAWVNLGVEDILNSIWWNEKFYMLCYDPSNQLRTRSGDGSNWSTSTDLISSADLLTVDQWAFVASTINTSDGSRKIFVDGASVASDTGTGMGGGTNSCNMGIGGVVSAACGSGYWRGKIAHALLYERALSDAEIKDFYNKTKARFGH